MMSIYSIRASLISFLLTKPAFTLANVKSGLYGEFIKNVKKESMLTLCKS